MADIGTLIRSLGGEYASWTTGDISGSALAAAIGSETTLTVSGYDVYVQGACSKSSAWLTVTSGTFRGDANNRTVLAGFGYGSFGTIENCVFNGFGGTLQRTLLIQGDTTLYREWTLRNCRINGGPSAEWLGVDACPNNGNNAQPTCTVTGKGEGHVTYSVGYNPKSWQPHTRLYAVFVKNGYYLRVTSGSGGTSSGTIYLDESRFSLDDIDVGDKFVMLQGGWVDCTLEGNEFRVGHPHSTGGYYGEPGQTLLVCLYGDCLGTTIVNNNFVVDETYKIGDGGGMIVAICDVHTTMTGTTPIVNYPPYSTDFLYPNSFTTVQGNTFTGFRALDRVEGFRDRVYEGGAWYNATWMSSFTDYWGGDEETRVDTWADARFTSNGDARKHGTVLVDNVWPEEALPIVIDSVGVYSFGNSAGPTAAIWLDPYYWYQDQLDNPRNGSESDPYVSGDQTATTFLFYPPGTLPFDLSLDFYDVYSPLPNTDEAIDNRDTVEIVRIMRLPYPADNATATDAGFLGGAMALPSAQELFAEIDAGGLDALLANRYDFTLAFEGGATPADIGSAVESASDSDSITGLLIVKSIFAGTEQSVGADSSGSLSYVKELPDSSESPTDFDSLELVLIERSVLVIPNDSPTENDSALMNAISGFGIVIESVPVLDSVIMRDNRWNIRGRDFTKPWWIERLAKSPWNKSGKAERVWEKRG